jgi:substrate import-associated zinc metallohydrolase lipoprotein
MKKLIIIFSIITMAVSVSSCQKDDLSDLNSSILDLGGEDIAQNETDIWLYNNYVKPYNMEVKYKWDQFELALNRTLVPVYEEKVIPIMNMIKKTWIDPYEKVAGPTFIKKLSPKKFVLVGSPQYNSGTITLGEAEGGRKIVMYRLNWFTESDVSLIRAIMKTVHHEFGHTMHQTIMYPEEFMYITPSAYTSSWNNVSDLEATKLGFISSYATANSDEDFVEMLSKIVVYGREAFEQRVALATSIYNDPAQNTGMTYDPGAALRQKEAILISYLKQVWGVDLYDPSPGVKGLVTLVQEAINEISGN